MDDIIVVKLTKGAELVGRHVSNPLNSKVVLDDALNVLMQPTGGRPGADRSRAHHALYRA